MANPSKVDLIALKIRYFLLGKNINALIEIESNPYRAQYDVTAVFHNNQIVSTVLDAYADFDVVLLDDEFIAACLMVHDI
jgi:hypothetical protein